MTLFSVVLSAEPASILYIVTGAVGFAYTRLRKRRKPDAPTLGIVTPMLFCHSASRRLVRDVGLL